MHHQANHQEPSLFQSTAFISNDQAGSNSLVDPQLLDDPFTAFTNADDTPTLNNYPSYHVCSSGDDFDWSFWNAFPVPMSNTNLISLPPASGILSSSGCDFLQPIAPAPTHPNITPTGLGATATTAFPVPRVQCTFQGCMKTFRRVGDCRRHMRKHKTPNLRCIDTGCDMRFTRMGKLRDHLREGHKLVL